MSDPYSPYPPQHSQSSAHPQQPPPTMGYHAPPPRPSSPGVSKAAVGVMLLLAALFVVGGLRSVLAMPADQFTANVDPADLAQLEAQGVDADQIRSIAVASGVACVSVLALIFLAFAPFVWKNRGWANITVIVISALLLVLGGLGLLASLVGPSLDQSLPRPTTADVLIQALQVLGYLTLIVLLALALRRGGRRDEDEMARQALAQQAAWNAYYAGQNRQNPPPQQ